MATLTQKASTTIVTGDRFTLVFTFAIDQKDGNGSQPIASTTDVQVSIINDTRTDTLVTPRAATYQAGTSNWSVTFTEEETKTLLSDPTNLGSSLQYKTCTIEMQAGTPYFKTSFLEASISKGLTP